MYRIYVAFIEIIAAAVFIIPIWCIYNKLRFNNWKKTIIYMIFAFYLTTVLVLKGFPSVTYLKINITLNINPFVGMAADFTNSCLNVLLFVPLGFFMPILWDDFRKIENVALTGVVTSLFIEISQIFTYRATDINDIITNTIGTTVGYFIARLITDKFTKRVLSNSKISDFYIICVTVV